MATTIREIAQEVIDDVIRKGLYIELHERRKTDDGKFFNMPVMVCVADIVSIEMSDAMIEGCYLSLRGRKKALHISENYQDVRMKIYGALDKKKHQEEAEKQIKPYHVDRSVKCRGVHVVIVERATQIWYGVLCCDLNQDNWLCVKMKKNIDGYLYPWVGSEVIEIPCKLVEN